LKEAELIKIRQYSELKVDILLQKALADPNIRKYIPEHNYPAHKLDKQFLLAVNYILYNEK